MRKVFLFNLISVDGFFEGSNRDITWHQTDKEFADFAIEQLNEIDTLLFGRVTYQLMASYWPTQEAIQSDPETAKQMNEKEKVVFSTTLNSANWENTRIVKENAAEEIRNLKKKEGKSIAIFGSSDLAASLAKENVIDEYRILINPLFLGHGKTLLQGITEKVELSLIKSKVFGNGNVLLCYKPK